MELNLRNPIDFIIFAVIVVVIIALVVGVISIFPDISFGGRGWKDNFEAFSNYNDFDGYEFTIRRPRDEGIDGTLQIESIVFKIYPNSGLNFKYTWKPDYTFEMDQGDYSTITVYFDEIDKLRGREVGGMEVVKINFSKVD